MRPGADGAGPSPRCPGDGRRPARPTPAAPCSARRRSARWPRSWACVRPRRSGQNFVIDANTVRRIVRVSGVGADDVVLEVGPGLGSLTLALLDAVRHVVAVEIDPVLAEQLPVTVAERAPALAERLTVVAADALRITRPAGRPDRAGRQPALQRQRPGPAAPAGHVPDASSARW